MAIRLPRLVKRKERRAVSQFPWEEVFASMGDGLVVADSARRLVGINPAAERLLGLSAEAALGYLLEEVFEKERGLLDHLLPAMQETRTWTLRDLAWENHQGLAVHTDLSLSPLMDADGDPSGWVLIFRDMSPVRHLQEEVRKADRLAMMGTIASGLAHEIKNPLGGIKGAAQMIARGGAAGERQEYLDIIVRESERVDRLITDLLSFTRPRPLHLKGCNLNEVLDEILLLQSEAIGNQKIQVAREFDPSLPKVLADREQLTQLFLNLVKNAVEAMPGGGHLSLRTRVKTDVRIKDTEEKRSYRMVVAEIEDSGIGMTDEEAEKVFTPFFTTKERGSGLGMAIAQRIVLEHHAAIRLASRKGQGTTVTVSLRSVA